jgi:hypothetical protein
LYVYPTSATAQISEYALGEKTGKSLNTRFGADRKIGWSSFDGTWRLHGEQWRVNWLLYASTGVESKCNRVARFLGIGYYKYTAAQELTVGFSGSLTIETDHPFIANQKVTTVQPFNDSRTTFGRSHVQHYFDQATAVINFTKGYIKPAKLVVKSMTINSVYRGKLNNVTRQFSL